MYAQLVNNLDELGFTDVEPCLSEYLTKSSKEGISILKYRNENFKPIDNFFVKDKLGNQYCLAYTLENQKRVKIEFDELNTI